MATKRRRNAVGLDRPLALVDPRKFEPLDEGEMQLICHDYALDLVLIENATELFRQGFHGEGVLEQALDKIVKGSKLPGATFLPSEAFPMYMPEASIRQFYPYDGSVSAGDKLRRKYFQQVSAYRQQVESAKRTHTIIVTVLAVDLGLAGGHYAAVFYVNGVANIFDSMQYRKGKKEEGGYYTPYFTQLVQDAFGSQVAIPDCISAMMTPQMTGGFFENRPQEVDRSLARRRIDEDRADLLSRQSTDSQNHFCYMWALWRIHLYLQGIPVEPVLRDIVKSGYDPLFIIKRYSWCMFHLLGLNQRLGDYVEFFNTHFPAVWANVPLGNKLSPDFTRYQLAFDRSDSTCNNVNEALEKSLNQVRVIPVQSTPVPPGVCP